MKNYIEILMNDPEEFKAKLESERLDLNTRDEYGKTILHYLTASLVNAPKEMKEDIFAAMKYILDLGAAPHVLDSNGMAAGAYIDQIEENDSALKMIFEAQQKFNPRNDQGRYSPIEDRIKSQAQSAAAPLQELRMDSKREHHHKSNSDRSR